MSRMDEAKCELWTSIKTDELPASALLLVMANKQDLPSSASIEEISEKLELEKIRDRTWSKFI